MKKILSVLLIAMCAMTASAQITWNAKLGLGFSNCISSEDNSDVKTHFVGKAGVGMEYPLSANFSLMPSAEFAIKGAKWGFSEDYESYSETMNLYYFQIPVLAAYRFNLTNKLNLVLKAGPYFAFAMAGNVKYDYSSNYGSASDNDDVFDLGAKRFEVGVDFGVDLEFKRFVVGAEYEIGITPLIKEDGGSLRNSAFYVTVGYKF